MIVAIVPIFLRSFRKPCISQFTPEMEIFFMITAIEAFCAIVGRRETNE